MTKLQLIKKYKSYRNKIKNCCQLNKKIDLNREFKKFMSDNDLIVLPKTNDRVTKTLIQSGLPIAYLIPKFSTKKINLEYKFFGYEIELINK